ncbi:unnamed protein product [Vitrella brassicaformis CCMP3155]|uniref:MORN repeat protein n=1 Tax=Vitrella brassicaformis (strain CCMP3155) TaxID=1169540 RepID=A0A0G4EVZ9_VITBC|nr:unnamed protein product [Vitrella brassicaformis CCMP3155]|eukprot:CEM02612.1 unnamed protein product [Vitrella brassicaformis CCMP3155]
MTQEEIADHQGTSADTDTTGILHNVMDDLRRSMDRERQQYEMRIEELQAQRDEYKTERDGWKRRCERAEAQRDEAHAELKELRRRQVQDDHITPRKIVHRDLLGMYYGSVVNGLPDGAGLLRSFDEQEMRYEGEWRNGKYHGKGKEYGPGVVRTKEGGDEAKICVVYDGDFVDGKREGRGTKYQAYNGGMVKLYEGEWKDNQWHGEGDEYQHGTLVYRGGWANGKRHGQGEEFINDKVTYRGEWVNGEKNGAVVATGMLWEVHFYHGPTLDGRPHGEGELRDGNNKPIYKGEWKSGKRHGQAKAYYHFDGPMLWFDGEWREGLARSGTLFPDGTWRGGKKADGSPEYPITPIRWQAGQDVPETDLRGVGGWKLHWWLQNRGVSRYFPAGALS